ncbi:MAG: tRNA (5-methylaminomethyl-2-thiouridine)(34)-methyltransferase MnmD [Crocinitomicaceae bacterium]|nr:tRNA (5-methylaminomethyl-2-thiouridine)(34)-methyltransferase MnmD [Crocinitomicaceae bacterium]
MKREILSTNDGSTTIFIPDMDETYHSTHGAIQEALHVFIENGLREIKNEITTEVHIFEMGFGTGLNALLTASNSKGKVCYTGVEAYPVEKELLDHLNYAVELGGETEELFQKIISSPWNQNVEICADFILNKVHSKIEEYSMPRVHFDLVFYDAFGPRAQSSMWEMKILSKIVDGLKAGGVLVTYCAMGQFKRDLKALGMRVESRPGPPGKREMTVATKM